MAKSREKARGALMANYGMGIDEVRLDLRTEASVLVRKASGLILRRSAGRRALLTPRWHSDVEAFLKALAVDAAAYRAIFWLLAFFLNLAEPVPALWLTGATGIGKSMLACGLAKLFARGKPVSGEKGVQQFNSAIADCPIVMFDEHPPRDSRGKTDLDLLKRLVTEGSHELERKGRDVEVLDGYLRVVLASNNLDMVKPDRDLTDQDVDAICGRIVHADCSAEQQVRVAQWVLGRHDPLAWINTLIPEHVLYMQQFQTHADAPARGRLRTPAHSASVRLSLLTESGRTPDLLLFFINFLVRHRASRGRVTGCDLILVRGGKLFATQGAIQQNWDALNPSTGVPGTQQIRACWNRVVVEGASISIRRGRESLKYREVRLGLLRAFVADNDYMGADELEEALAIATP